jgi:Tfp pilus assembly protein PilX
MSDNHKPARGRNEARELALVAVLTLLLLLTLI